MLNKKIASELAVGIVLVVSILIGSISWINAKKEVKEIEKVSEQLPIETRVIQVEVPYEKSEKFTYAYKTRKDGKEYYVIDGRYSEPFDNVWNFKFVKGNFIAEVEKEGKTSVIYNGVIIPFNGELVVSSGNLDESGSHFAFAATEKGRKYWMIDSQKQKEYDKGTSTYLNFSEDGLHHWYLAKADGKFKYVIDGKETLDFDKVEWDLKMNKSFDKYIFSAKEDDKYYYIINGAKSSAYDGVNSFFSISDDGQHYIYSIKKSGEDLVIFDGKELEWPLEDKWGMQLSGDGLHFAYSSEQAGKNFYVIDGKRTSDYDAVYGNIALSYSGQYAYKARKDKKEFYVIDGKEGEKFDEVDYISLSMDGTHHAYMAKNGNEYFIVVDGKKSESYDKAESFVNFSDEGFHYAYSARKNGKEFYVVDDVKSQLAEEVSGYKLFDKKGDNFAYILSFDNRNQVFVNHKGDPNGYDEVIGITFGESGNYSYLGRRDGKAYYIVNGTENLIPDLDPNDMYNFQYEFIKK